jgi:thiol-disulfide isomerase/thioredoxin
MQKLSVFAIFVLFGAIFLASPSARAQAAQGRRGGTTGTTPSFSLQKVSGGTLSSDDLKGKVTVIDVWATWCGHCLDEVKIYNQLYNEFQNQDVKIVGIAVDSPLKTIPIKVKQLGINYPVLIGDGTTMQTFGVNAFPTTFVLDKDGKIVKRYLGEVPNKQEKIRQDVQQLLSQGQGQDTNTPIS